VDDNQIKQMIRLHEGYVPRVYLDTVLVPTAGYGHAFHVGSKIPRKVAELLFEQDFDGVLKDYELMNLNLDPVRRAVILDMLFNLGILKLRGFNKTLEAIRSGDYEEAARQMLRSKWAKQVGPRAIRLAEMMVTGVSHV